MLSALPAYASLVDDSGLKATATESGIVTTKSNTIAGITGSVISIVLPFAGTIIVVLFIYAGFLWMTAQGDEGRVKQAKLIIRNAIIGTVLMFSSYVIANTVANSIGTILTQ